MSPKWVFKVDQMIEAEAGGVSSLPTAASGSVEPMFVCQTGVSLSKIYWFNDSWNWCFQMSSVRHKEKMSHVHFQLPVFKQRVFVRNTLLGNTDRSFGAFWLRRRPDLDNLSFV